MRAAVPLLSMLVLPLLAVHASAQTLGFREAVELARSTEPVFLGAKATTVAAQERTRLALAGLLPQVNVSASTNTNRRDYHQQGDGSFIDYYNSNNAQVSLTQPLFRRSNLYALRQAETAASQADYQLVAAEQELLAKLVSAWLDVMAARDDVLLTSRQATLTRQQWEILRRGVDLGTAAAPAAAEARARHEQALAESTSAEMDFHLRAAALEQVIGPVRSFNPPHLRAAEQMRGLAGDSLEEWLERVEVSPQVRAARHALIAADEEVRKQRAGYEPTVDLVSTYGRNAQQVGNFPGQPRYDIKTGTIGLQLTVPIFSGGGQQAKVAEAIALREKANQDLAATQRASRLAAKQAWYGWMAASSRHPAARQAVRSFQLALRAAVQGIASGVKTEADRLQASVQLEGARRDFNKARYDLIASFVRLRALAGALADDDMLWLEFMFVEQEPDVQELASTSISY